MAQITKAEKQPTWTPGVLAARHLTALGKGKAQYKRSDAALDALLQKVKPGEVITLPDAPGVLAALRGKKFKVVDKFEKKNQIGVGLSARRFELGEVTEP